MDTLTAPLDDLPPLRERPLYDKVPGYHSKLHSSCEQRENLLKLADYLATLPKGYKHFEMAVFFCFDKKENDRQTTPPQIIRYKRGCGTIACAVGHGPTAGIENKGWRKWGEYTQGAFGIDTFSGDFQFLFSSDWSHYDNTPQGAANRIYYALQHGIPTAASHNGPWIYEG
jgi:hypothetical protein